MESLGSDREYRMGPGGVPGSTELGAARARPHGLGCQQPEFGPAGVRVLLARRSAAPVGLPDRPVHRQPVLLRPFDVLQPHPSAARHPRQRRLRRGFGRTRTSVRPLRRPPLRREPRGPVPCSWAPTRSWVRSSSDSGWADPGTGASICCWGGRSRRLAVSTTRSRKRKGPPWIGGPRAAGVAPAVGLAARPQWTSRRLLVCGVRFCSVSVSTPSSKRASAPASVTSTGSSNVRA